MKNKIDGVTPEEYAAQWGCDPVYDRSPNEKGDGYKFYNFNVLGNDPEFLTTFIPAIKRTIEFVRQRPDADMKKNIRDLSKLLKVCEERLETLTVPN
jgi:hypothetical protein